MLAESTIEGSQNKKFKMGLDINDLMGLFRTTDADAGAPGEFSNGRDAEQDVGSLMQSMRGVTRKQRPERQDRQESEVYGRRW